MRLIFSGLALVAATSHLAIAAPELKLSSNQPAACGEQQEKIRTEYFVTDAGAAIGGFDLCRRRDDPSPAPQLVVDGKGRVYILIEDEALSFDVTFLTILRMREGWQEVFKMPIGWPVDMTYRYFIYRYETEPGAGGGFTLRLRGQLPPARPGGPPPCCTPTGATLAISIDEDDD